MIFNCLRRYWHLADDANLGMVKVFGHVNVPEISGLE